MGVTAGSSARPLPRGQGAQRGGVTAGVYLRLLVAAGLVVLAASLWLLAPAGAEGEGGAAGWLVTTLPLLTVGLLVGAAVVAQHFPFSLGTGHKVMLGGAVYFADVLLLGPLLAVPVVGASELLGQALLTLRRDPLSGRRRRGPAGVAFNTAQQVLATAAGGAVYGLLLWGWPGAGGWSVLVPGGARRRRRSACSPPGGRRDDPRRQFRCGVHHGGPAAGGASVAGVAHQPAGAPDGDGWGVPGRLLPGLGPLPGALAPTARRGQRGGGGALPGPPGGGGQAGGPAGPEEAEAEALRELARRKDEFLGTVSHELRTPLTVVCGYAELLLARDAGLDGEARRMMGSLLTSATQLSLMVDDMLDFARVERGVLACRPREVDLVPVVRLSLVTLRGLRGGERVRADLPGHFLAYADPERCGQIVNRLVANSLQHAPGTEVTVRLYTPAGEPQRARLEVQDGGPGIPEAELVKVWEPFFRGQGAASRRSGGAGIGLALVKAIAEAQAGEVGAWSGAGRGSRFWVDLPLAPPGERHKDTTMVT